MLKLFFRDKRNGLILTDVGQKILLLAKQIEDLDNRIAQTAYRENHFVEGRLRIAALTSLVSTILSKALKAYRAAFPGVTVEIKEGSPNDIFRMVEEHSVDFAVSCSPFGKFDSIVLRRDRMAAMLPKEYPGVSEVDLTAPPDLLIINKSAYETILDYVRQPPLPDSSFRYKWRKPPSIWCWTASELEFYRSTRWRRWHRGIRNTLSRRRLHLILEYLQITSTS